MGFRFRKSIKILPGLRLNLSRSGVSANIGVRGANISVGPRGTYVNAGIPGSGVSYRDRIDAGDNSHLETPQLVADQQPRNSAVPRVLVVIAIIAIIAVAAIVAGSK
jgi:hypothetical protein